MKAVINCLVVIHAKKRKKLLVTDTQILQQSHSLDGKRLRCNFLKDPHSQTAGRLFDGYDMMYSGPELEPNREHYQFFEL